MEATNILIPAASGGRIVMGNPLKGFSSDPQGRPYLNKGNQLVTKYAFNVAVPKTDPSVGAILAQLNQIARTGFPSLFDPNGACLHPQFAFKYVDGDSPVPDQTGVRWCDKEGYLDHWVFKFSSQFVPKCYTEGGAQAIVDPTQLKTGDYVRVWASVLPNGDTAKPGLFLNPSIVEFVGYGKEISNGPNPVQVFGSVPLTSRPAGASATPVTSAPPIAPPPVPRSVTPAPDFLRPPAPAIVVERFKVPGNEGSFTRERLIAAGWAPEEINTLQRA